MKTIRFLGVGILTACIISLGIFTQGCSSDFESDVKIENLDIPEYVKLKSGQALPGGKKYFSTCVAHFRSTGAFWVRMVNWTFNNTNGTVSSTYWMWSSNLHKGKMPYNSHICTFDGVTKTSTVYTPTGWGNPPGQYTQRTGNYTYNSTTHMLNITWPGGQTESWEISNPDSKIAFASFVSSNYYISHGHGYGSNSPFSVYKTIEEIPKIQYPGGHVLAKYDGSTNIVIPNTTGDWYYSPNGGLDLSLYKAPSSPNPKNTLHYWQPTSSVCMTNVGNPRTGIIYHLASNNKSRSMVYNHFCATLPTEDEWPTYDRNLHPYAFQQIIDDAGDLRGFIGIEQQDEGAPYVGYQYQLKDYTTVGAWH